MNKIIKNILITTVIIIGVIFAFKSIAIGISESLSSTGKTIGSVYGTDCKEKQNWTVGKYKIQEYECIGFVGPHYRKFDLLENEKIVEDYVSMTDTCTVNFQKQNDLVIRFNLCSKTISELKPQIVRLNLSNIDSIQIYSDSLDKNYRLSHEQTKIFVNDWNKRQVDGYSEQPFDSSFSKNLAYTSYYYQLTIFSNKIKNHYYGRDNIILDSLNWKYLIGKNGKEDYFRKKLID